MAQSYTVLDLDSYTVLDLDEARRTVTSYTTVAAALSSSEPTQCGTPVLGGQRQFRALLKAWADAVGRGQRLAPGLHCVTCGFYCRA